MLRTLTISLLIVFPRIASAQATAAMDSVADAWALGRYPAALERLEGLLASADGGGALVPAALLTGELFHTDSIAADGSDVRWSRDGRFAAYATGTGAARKTVILEPGGSRRPVIIAGRGLTFSPTGTEAAYLTGNETPAVAAARAKVDAAMRARDFRALQSARRELDSLESEVATVRVRDLRSGREREIRAPGLARQAIAWAADGKTLYLVGGPAGEAPRSDVYALAGTAAPAPMIEGPGPRSALHAAPGGRYLVLVESGAVVVRDLSDATTRTFPARSYSIAANGSAIAFVQRESGTNVLTTLRLVADAQPATVLRSTLPIDNPALSPDGSQVVYQMMPRENWELYLATSDGGEPRRLTHEVQHDIFPRFLGNDRVLAVLGEARHRRSCLLDLTSGERTRLFHNNTVRTVSAEYEWAASPDGTRVLIVAERDGDTISPERSVYLTDLSRRVTLPELQERVRTSLAAERDLRERGRRTFAPIEARVRAAAEAVSAHRIYGYGRDLHAFETKYIGKPGNLRAIEYLAGRLREFGYEPELQWFEPRPGIRSANVVARLRGTSDSSLVYVISSHFDSVEEGPGADDNTSGSSALLEAARVLARDPQAATIEFAFFTGEEAGLLGSREFVRRAVASGKRIVGALNNDMVGFANDERMDNTIRYSNDGLRDLQHAAAFLFTGLVTYDARYYKSTDAHAYYEQYGDIVGGIGSYPILGNPHYHQSHDVLETVNQQLIAEVSRTTVASIMAMASAPSRLKGLAVAAAQGGATATWEPAAEQGVTGYVVAYGPAADPAQKRITVTEPRASLPGAVAGTVVSVKATGAGGVEGWDWMRATVR
jgi:hypothetical protein